MTAEKEEKGKIQLVTPLPLQQRWETLQDSPKYKDKAKYKLMEDMITSMEITVFGAEHPEYEQQLADVDKCWTTVRNFLSRLIDDTTKAEENARKSVSNTLRTLENEAEKVQRLEKERDEYWRKYYDVRKHNEDLVKSLEEEKARTVEALARCKEAEAKASELQNQLNEANDAIVKQMQEFINNFAHDAKKMETATTDNVPPVPPEADEPASNISATPDEVVTVDTASAVPPTATTENTHVADAVSPSVTDTVEPDATAIADAETVVPEKRRGRRKSKA